MVERLLTFGMSYDDAMKAAGAALDLAAAKHMDLESAASIMGKAFTGNTAILARYGIDITTSKEATAAMKEAVEGVAGALKTAGADALKPFADVLGEASVSLTTSEGKMRSAKDVASDLIGAFQSGAIDGEKFAQIMDALGVSIDTSKLKAADFPAVMASLNEQFGGAAQDQAKTYAGVQERLKNAVSDLGERIGGALLPALAGLTEGMVGVVDGVNRGIDALGAWFAEIAKSETVKPVIDALGDAFSGLQKFFEDLGKAAMEILGPALDELWNAFKEIWDALAPIGQAIAEIIGIFTEGGASGGALDLFKLIIHAIALEIRGFAEIIKAVAPYIKQFAEGFKAAADFIAPILGQLRDAIGGFLDWLKGAFQGFYAWLVGGSLWMDMWNQVLSVAGSMVSKLLGDLGSKLFEPMKDAFTGAVQWVEDSWNKGWEAIHGIFMDVSERLKVGVTDFLDSAKTTVSTGLDNIRTNWETNWQTVQTTFETISSQIQSSLNTRFEAMKSFVTESLGEYAPIANNALTAMQSTMNAFMALIHGDWQGFLDNMNLAMTSFWSAIQGVTNTAFMFLQDSFTGSMNAVRGILDGAIGVMQGAWGAFMGFMQAGIAGLQSALGAAESFVGGVLGSMQSAANAAVSYISSTISSAWSDVEASTQDFADKMYKHSIWPDMLTEMQRQTEVALGNIVSDFEGAFGNVALAAPTPTMQREGRVGLTEPVSVSLGSQSITVPITVTLDGQTIARTVKKILLEQRQYQERSVGRLT
jgi:phage-related protein